MSERSNKLPTVLLDEHELEHGFVIYKNQCAVIVEKISKWIREEAELDT